MILVAGIDPGTNGALAVYDAEAKRLVSVHDLPMWYQSVGKKKRKRLDPIAVAELFETLNLMGVRLVVMEAVGGRPRQSASAAFVFGYTVGLLYMAALNHRIMVETVPPLRWKGMMRIPGKMGHSDKLAQKKAKGDIMMRVQELFPDEREMFRGDRDGYKMDRADAALLAKFAGDFVWKTVTPAQTDDVEFKLAYRNAETGA
jgi:hypothetical protein